MWMKRRLGMLTCINGLMAVWGHILVQEAPGVWNQQTTSASVVMSTQSSVIREKGCVLGGRVVVVILGGAECLAACGLVHHRCGTISCNLYQLTRGTSDWRGEGEFFVQQRQCECELAGWCYNWVSKVYTSPQKLCCCLVFQNHYRYLFIFLFVCCQTIRPCAWPWCLISTRD